MYFFVFEENLWINMLDYLGWYWLISGFEIWLFRIVIFVNEKKELVSLLMRKLIMLFVRVKFRRKIK